MNCEKHRLWDFDDNVDYTAYLHETQPEDDNCTFRGRPYHLSGRRLFNDFGQRGRTGGSFLYPTWFSGLCADISQRTGAMPTHPNALYDLGKMMLTIHENVLVAGGRKKNSHYRFFGGGSFVCITGCTLAGCFFEKSS